MTAFKQAASSQSGKVKWFEWTHLRTCCLEPPLGIGWRVAKAATACRMATSRCVLHFGLVRPALPMKSGPIGASATAASGLA